MKKNIIICLPILTLLFSGCDINSPESLIFNSPDCRIINTEIFFRDFGFTTMTITVENDGDGPTAFDIGCAVRLKSGNYIADESTAYFGYLEINESKTEEIWFTKVKEEDDFVNTEIVLFWYDAEGTYYFETY